jgi:hypothetical protein
MPLSNERWLLTARAAGAPLANERCSRQALLDCALRAHR